MRSFALVLLLITTVAGRSQPFSVTEQIVSAPEMEPFQQLSIRFAEGEYVLVPPPLWRKEILSAERKVRFTSQSYGSVLIVTLSTNEVLATLNAPQAFSAIAPDVPALAEAEEFKAIAGDRQGRGIESGFALRGHPMRCRAAILPIKGGVASFVLTCSSNEIESARNAFGGVLTSFQQKGPHHENAHPSPPARRVNIHD